MPTVTVGDVLTEAQALLNDTGASIYTQAVMLPFINKAYRELQSYFIDNGIQVLNEISADVSVLVGNTTVTPSIDIGSDFVEPSFLQERAFGSTNEDDWVDMTERDWEPSESPTTTLGVWAWRKQLLKFRGATTDREVRVFFHRSLTKFTAPADEVGIEGSATYLASRAASIAALLIGENLTRSETLNGDAEIAKETLFSINGKKRQSVPKRRRGFRRPRRRFISI